MDLISIIVPVYNVEQYLNKCLDSIINQTYKHLEIILVDDGSTDNSGIICDEYASRDSRVKVIHKDNGGLSDARNVGMDIALGDYIGFIDSDDYIALDMFESLYDFAIQNQLDVAMCGAADVIDGNVVYDASYFDPFITENTESIIQNIFVNPNGGAAVGVWTRLYKKKVINDIRFEYGKFSEDVYFVLKWIEKTTKFGRFYDYKYYYVQRLNSITHLQYYSPKILDVVDGYEKNYNYILKKYPKCIKAAESRLVWANMIAFERIMICIDVDSHNAKLEKIRANLKKMSFSIFNNEWISFNRKIGIFLICLDIRLFSMVKKFRGKIKDKFIFLFKIN